jgi:hypothetical protein
MCEVYKIFGRHHLAELDFSEDALVELFNLETYGEKRCGSIKPTNGFYHGKRLLNVTVSMWKEDMEGKNKSLLKFELYEDPMFPHWWLDSIFKK